SISEVLVNCKCRLAPSRFCSPLATPQLGIIFRVSKPKLVRSLTFIASRNKEMASTRHQTVGGMCETARSEQEGKIVLPNLLTVSSQVEARLSQRHSLRWFDDLSHTILPTLLGVRHGPLEQSVTGPIWF